MEARFAFSIEQAGVGGVRLLHLQTNACAHSADFTDPTLITSSTEILISPQAAIAHTYGFVSLVKLCLATFRERGRPHEGQRYLHMHIRSNTAVALARALISLGRWIATGSADIYSRSRRGAS